MEKLHKEFVRLGSQRHKLKNQMLAILPEIYKSGVWKKYAGSIVEYAGKYGDIAQSTVKKRLRLEEKLKDKPCLKAAIEKVGIHKVAMVATITTPQTDSVMADKVLNMSKAAVQTMSMELRGEAPTRTARVELDEKATFLLMKLKQKLGKNMSDKNFIKKLLEEKAEAEFPHQVITGDAPPKTITGDEPRYITVAEKRQAAVTGKCAHPGCNRPYEVLHHRDRYSTFKNHQSIIPLCKIHHEYAHNNLIANEKGQPKTWKLTLFGKPTEADLLYKKYRREAVR